MVKQRKSSKSNAMEVDDSQPATTSAWSTGLVSEMDTSDFMPLQAKPQLAPGKKQQGRLGLQPVKLKPKRGRSTKKQKRRRAAKLDKAMAVADRGAAKSRKREAHSAIRLSSKSLWGAKAKALLDQADVS